MIEEKKHSLYPRMSKAKDHISRRDFLWMTAASTVGLAQGVSTRNLKPLPRGKPSGIPFLARFTDVAAQAGLTFPVVYGGLTHKNYIIETVGCGVAFLDFDNDGWLDPGWDVHRCYGEGRVDPFRVGQRSNRRRLQQRRI